MTLTASAALSARLDGMIYTSLVPVPDPPTVTTNSVTGITANAATSGGVVTSDGGAPVTARGVCWSTTPAPTILDSHTSDGSGTGPFTSVMTGLTPATTYYVRAYATNLSGTGYGQEFSFTTMHDMLFVSGVAEPGEFNCFDATQVITVAGTPDTFIANASSTTILIAGQTIRLLPGTWFKHSSYMHGYIAPLGPWCDQLYPPSIPSLIASVEPALIVDRPSFMIYPNPTTGDFTVIQKGDVKFETLGIEIRDMQGTRILKQTLEGTGTHVVHLTDIKPGMYIVKVVANGYVETIKLIKVN
jgi:hypothetical protein